MFVKLDFQINHKYRSLPPKFRFELLKRLKRTFKTLF
jgi:hypothetical protein